MITIQTNNYIKKFEVVKHICSGIKEDKILVFNQYNKQTNNLNEKINNNNDSFKILSYT
jgi:superfamily II DNA/RNA helicase